MSETLYIVDAFSLIFQVFYAIPEMTGPAGQPTNAVYGVTRDMLYLLNQKRPDYLLCAFDSDGATVRHEIYSEYKANRGPMPDELRPQIEMILRLLEVLEIPVLSLDGYEADDVIATVAGEASGRGVQSYIVTGDKDLRQLIGNRVFLYNVRKDLVLDAEALQKDWGVRPDQVIDLLALTGDNVDNVPGVPGVGVKTAAKLLSKYETLDGVLAHLNEQTPKLRENLGKASEQIRMSRQLVSLYTDLPLSVDWEACRIGGFRRQKVLDFFAEFGFHRFAEEVGGGSEKPATWEATYRKVESIAQLRELVKAIQTAGRVSVDTETTSVVPTQAELVGIVLCWNLGEAWYVPVRTPPGEPSLDLAEVLSVLKPVLEDKGLEKVGQNLKYDWLVLRRAGVRLDGVAVDTMVASYLLDAGERNHSLDQLSLRYLDHTMIPISDLMGKGRQQKRMDEVEVEKVVDYACEDADVALRLCEILQPRLHEEGLWDLYEKLERPLIEVLAQMEYNGIAVDLERLAALSADFEKRLESIELQIFELAGRTFNIGSPLQLREVLFDELSLPILRKTKTGASTDQSVLEQLARDHPLPGLLIEHRKLAKLKGTYLDALPQMVHPETGRIHASFHQAVAATGRLSSSDPNLQNIPVRTQEGRQIRQAFIAGRPGWQLLTADYSQIELRILAHLSGDEALRHAFQEDEDIHAFVAGQVYGVEPSEVNSEMRRTAKMVNFGVIYGLSPFGLASRLGIPQEEAAVFIDSYFARYPGVEKFLTKILDQGRENGYVSTILGRRRSISGIRSVPSRQRNLPERTAINTVIQGSAADLIKQAMIPIHCRLSDENFSSKMLLQIHDELVFEGPPEAVERLARLVTEEMVGALELDVPLKVDLAVGPNWLEVEPLQLARSGG